MANNVTKAQIVAGMKRFDKGESVEKICDDLSISKLLFYKCYSEVARTKMSQVNVLEAENNTLKEMLSEKLLELDALKEQLVNLHNNN